MDSILRQNTQHDINVIENGRQEGHFSKMVLGAPVDGVFPVIHFFYNDGEQCLLPSDGEPKLVKIKVIKTLRLFFLRFMCISARFQI